MIAIDALKLKIADLESKLALGTPDYKILLAEIHATLLADAEMVHLLKTEGELSVVLEGLRKYKNVEIPMPAKSKMGESGKIKGPVSLDQF